MSPIFHMKLAIRQRSKDHKHLTPGNGHPENRVSIYFFNYNYRLIGMAVPNTSHSLHWFHCLLNFSSICPIFVCNRFWKRGQLWDSRLWSTSSHSHRWRSQHGKSRRNGMLRHSLGVLGSYAPLCAVLPIVGTFHSHSCNLSFCPSVP